MKVVVVIDSFKGSLSSMMAGLAIKEGIQKVYSDSQVEVCPIADGGEGTVAALVEGMNGQFRVIEVQGPLETKVACCYGIINGDLAVIEMAEAAGLTLVPEARRNPLNTTTYGVGEVILDAISQGCRRFIIGIGGSATNDGGVGMLQALGFQFLDENNQDIELGAKGLAKLVTIKTDQAKKELQECTFMIACDVSNPLCGKLGASNVYGKQKGANPNEIMLMDQWLANLARLTGKINSQTNPDYPGTGAAGGLGFAFYHYLSATLASGIELILQETKLEEKLADANLVITGEGRLDFQSAMGKAPIGVASLAKKHSLPVIAFAGGVTPEAKECNLKGIDAYFPILRQVCTLEKAMEPKQAKQNLVDSVEQVMRLWQIRD